MGKSTLLNRIIDENRVITGSLAGLTRDAIAVDFESETSRYSIVDTAGIRKAGRREADGDIIEDDSVREAMRAMKLAHVCILVLEGGGHLGKNATAKYCEHSAPRCLGSFAARLCR